MQGLFPAGFFLPLLNAADLSGVVLNPATGAALFVAILMIIMYYLLSKFLNSPQIEAFSREELSHFGMTVLILALWLSLYTLASQIISLASCSGAHCDQFSLAFYALDILRSRLMGAYIAFWSLELWVGILSTVGFSIPLGDPVMVVKWLSVSPLGGLGMLSNVLVNVIEAIGMLVGLVVGREQLLSFFQSIVPTFLLPLGLLMRALPFSRVTGSSIIAICFAGFFIFPFSIALSHYMMFTAYTPTFIPILPTPTGFCEDPSDPASKAAAEKYIVSELTDFGNRLSNLPNPSYPSSAWYDMSSIIDKILGVLKMLLGGVYDIFKEHFNPFGMLVSLLKPTTFGYLFYYIALDRMQGFAQLAVLTLVTFVLEIIITVTGYRAISAAIGGELEILGLTKVV